MKSFIFLRKIKFIGILINISYNFKKIKEFIYKLLTYAAHIYIL